MGVDPNICMLYFVIINRFFSAFLCLDRDGQTAMINQLYEMASKSFIMHERRSLSLNCMIVKSSQALLYFVQWKRWVPPCITNKIYMCWGKMKLNGPGTHQSEGTDIPGSRLST